MRPLNATPYPHPFAQQLVKLWETRDDERMQEQRRRRNKRIRGFYQSRIGFFDYTVPHVIRKTMLERIVSGKQIPTEQEIRQIAMDFMFHPDQAPEGKHQKYSQYYDRFMASGREFIATLTNEKMAMKLAQPPQAQEATAAIECLDDTPKSPGVLLRQLRQSRWRDGMDNIIITPRPAQSAKTVSIEKLALISGVNKEDIVELENNRKLTHKNAWDKIDLLLIALQATSEERAEIERAHTALTPNRSGEPDSWMGYVTLPAANKKPPLSSHAK